MSAPMLDLRGITIRFDGFTVLDDLDFSVARGELRFLIGPNGAGKTTLLDVVTGRVRPSAGQARFDGTIDIARHSEDRLARLGIGRKFQTPSVYGSLTVRENLVVAAGARHGLIRLFTGLPRGESDRIDGALETVGLTGRRHERAGTLSHGEKQWLEIAMLLIQDPRLLLLDEPVAGMTRQERDRTGHLLERIVAESVAAERSVLVVEHDMAFVRRYARRVTVLHQGRVLSDGAMDDVQRDPRVVEVYLGRSAEAA